MLATTRGARERDILRGALTIVRDTLQRAVQADGEPVSLSAWAQRFLPHYVPLDPCNFHLELFAQLNTMRDRRGQRFLVIAPRGSAKSTCSSVILVLHAICEGYEPYIVLGAETSRMAKRNLANIKYELLNNPLLAQEYPGAVGVDTGQAWRVDEIMTRNGVMVAALGSDQNIRGTRKGEQRPTLIIMDDPDPDDSIYSDAVRDKIKGRFYSSWMKAGEPSTNVLVIGTKLHEECLVSELASRPGWSGRHIYKSIISWPDRADLWEEWERIFAEDDDRATKSDEFYRAHEAEMLAGAEVIWPAREPLLGLMKVRAQDGAASFAREKQNEPLPPEGTRFDASWFEGEDLYFDDLPTTRGRDAIAFCVLDPATGKDKKRGDYPAIVWCWWIPGDRHLYIDADIERRTVPGTIETLVGLATSINFRVMGVEAIAFQSVVADNLRDAMNRNGFLVPVQPLENHENKFQRIDRLALYLKPRNFKFRRGSRGAARLLRQLRLYSNPPIDKLDGPDALEMLVRLVRMNVQGRAR